MPRAPAVAHAVTDEEGRELLRPPVCVTSRGAWRSGPGSFSALRKDWETSCSRVNWQPVPPRSCFGVAASRRKDCLGFWKIGPVRAVRSGSRPNRKRCRSTGPCTPLRKTPHIGTPACWRESKESARRRSSASGKSTASNPSGWSRSSSAQTRGSSLRQPHSTGRSYVKLGPPSKRH